MSLKVELKHGERIILGESLITNEGSRTKLKIDGSRRSCAKRTS